MPEPEIKECESCGAGLLAVSDICPQCGWSKDNHIGPDETEEIVDEDNPTKKLTKSTMKIPRPSSIRLLSFFYLIFGISLIIFAISFGAAVTFLVMSSGMSGLSEIGGAGSMMMPFGMGNMDSSTKSSLETIIGLHEIMGTSSVSEIENRVDLNAGSNPTSLLNSSALNVNEIMDVLMETTVIAIFEIVMGIFAALIGVGLLKGKKLARLAVIPTVIIIIPLVMAFAQGINYLVLFGMAAFGGITIYYMFKPKVREYFNQNSIENSEKIPWTKKLRLSK